MTARSVITGKAIPGQSGVTLIARILGNMGTPITMASLASIAYTVTDTTAGVNLGSGFFTVGGSVFDALVNGDPRWTQDSPQSPGPDGLSGYNFQATLPATLFPIRTPSPPDLLAGAPPGHNYQCDTAFTPVVGLPFRVSWRWPEEVVYG